MVIGSFPLGKVAVFAVKRISTPFSKLLLHVGKHSPLFRRVVIHPPGQLYHIMETRSKMRMLHLPQPRKIPPLTDPQATRLGANILSEVFVVLIGLGLIFFELMRQMRKDKKLHDDHTEKRRSIDERLAKIDIDVQRHEREISWLKKKLNVKGFCKEFCEEKEE